ncbi:MAG: hypothetical protein OEY58_19730 [Gammaproteobacteria bacterium]|nr:hypothetical protein [Gammaproteobacteria bacterium]
MNTQSNKIIRTPEQQGHASQVYDNYRSDLLNRSLSNTENYDKTIITLSAATLGFSMIAIRYVVPLESAEYTYLIQLGWFMLPTCIAASLVASLIGNKAIDVQLENARNYYIEGEQDALNRKNIYTTINKYLNIFTGIAFLSALFLIIIFVTVNIKKETDMGKDKFDTTDIQGTPVKKSADIPTMEQVPGTTPNPQGNNNGNQTNNSGKKPKK